MNTPTVIEHNAEAHDRWFTGRMARLKRCARLEQRYVNFRPAKPPPPPLPRPVVDRMARRMAAAVTWARLCAADPAPACGPLFLRAAQRAIVRRNQAAVLADLQAEWARGPRCAAWARAA